MEARGPLFTSGTPVNSMVWKWKLPEFSSVRLNDASTPCLSLSGKKEPVSDCDVCKHSEKDQTWSRSKYRSCNLYLFFFSFSRCRAFEDEGKARLGVVECAKHELLQPFTVLNEKEGEEQLILYFTIFWFSVYDHHITWLVFVSSGEFVAQFKFTVLLMANGPLRITSGPFEPELYKSEHEVQDPELKVTNLNRCWCW